MQFDTSIKHTCMQSIESVCLIIIAMSKISLVMNQKMNYFLEWLKQLFGETEGKSNRGIFSNFHHLYRDLHSLGQFIQEGTPLLFETVLKVEEGTEVAGCR